MRGGRGAISKSRVSVTRLRYGTYGGNVLRCRETDSRSSRSGCECVCSMLRPAIARRREARMLVAKYGRALPERGTRKRHSSSKIRSRLPGKHRLTLEDGDDLGIWCVYFIGGSRVCGQDGGRGMPDLALCGPSFFRYFVLSSRPTFLLDSQRSVNLCLSAERESFFSSEFGDIYGLTRSQTAWVQRSSPRWEVTSVDSEM